MGVRQLDDDRSPIMFVMVCTSFFNLPGVVAHLLGYFLVSDVKKCSVPLKKLDNSLICKI